MELVCAGRAFILSGLVLGAPLKPHLFFILTDPDPVTGTVIAAMVVTAKAHTDKTVTLHAGDHPFIRHESNVDFSVAGYIHPARLQRALAQGKCDIQPDIDAALLAKVRIGLLTSSRTINEIGDYCRSHFPADLLPD